MKKGDIHLIAHWPTEQLFTAEKIFTAEIAEDAEGERENKQN
jgi:hypothetical protein